MKSSNLFEVVKRGGQRGLKGNSPLTLLENHHEQEQEQEQQQQKQQSSNRKH